MQAIMETLFDVVYLATVTVLGILMIKHAKGNRQYLLFGIMAVVLGAGDAFHLVPRAIALGTTGLDQYTVALGIGKFITSITMTLFYILLYHVWRKRYNVVGKRASTATVYFLAVVRIALIMFPRMAGQGPTLLWLGESIATYPSPFWGCWSLSCSTAVPRKGRIKPSGSCGSPLP